jgi:hypothetical protein
MDVFLAGAVFLVAYGLIASASDDRSAGPDRVLCRRRSRLHRAPGLGRRDRGRLASSRCLGLGSMVPMGGARHPRRGGRRRGRARRSRRHRAGRPRSRRWHRRDYHLVGACRPNGLKPARPAAADGRARIPGACRAHSEDSRRLSMVSAVRAWSGLYSVGPAGNELEHAERASGERHAFKVIPHRERTRHNDGRRSSASMIPARSSANVLISLPCHVWADRPWH